MSFLAGQAVAVSALSKVAFGFEHVQNLLVGQLAVKLSQSVAIVGNFPFALEPALLEKSGGLRLEVNGRRYLL